MLYAVLFTDNPAHAEARRRLMPAHLDFLERHRAEIRAAGPLHEADGRGTGGLWLVDATSPAAVARLVESDPFWPTGLRDVVRILEWTLVFTDGKALPSPAPRALPPGG
jgi:uncharacterized protein YciI